MDIAAIQAFIEVARHRSFSKAAEALFLTQPAVSKRIAALEEELGRRLFDRIGRQILLTEAGKLLLPRANALIEETREMKRLVTNLSENLIGDLTMGTSHHIGLHRLPRVLKQFNSSHPEANLDIRFMDSEQACYEVEHGELELAIVTLPTNPAEGLEVTPIWLDRLRMVAGTDHPLAKSAPVPIGMLSDYPAVLPAKNTFTRSIIEDAFSRRETALQIGMSTNYLETLRMLAVTGFGWTVLPESMIDGELSVICDELVLDRPLGAVVHRSRTLSNAAKAMLDIAIN